MQAQALKLSSGWDDAQIRVWHDDVIAKGKVRDYKSDVASRVMSLPANTHNVETYATMSDGNPVFRITVGDVRNGKHNVLFNGGIHGYEPSGVHAALQFAKDYAPSLMREFNFVIYPCICPWAYEYDQRWNAQAQDPNRLFSRDKKFPVIEECLHYMDSMESSAVNFTLGQDHHETSDRDIELRILRAERFGSPLAADYKEIPQGFYLTLTRRRTAAENAHQLLFGQAIIDEVQKVSPIAPEATILEGKPNYGGVILPPPSEGLMRTYLDRYAKCVAVTEVYPDHKDMTPEKCVQAQIASMIGALNFVRGLHA